MDGILYIWYGPFQRWQRRYAVINNGQLYIYSSNDSKDKRLLESHYIGAANVTPDANSLLEWIIQAPGKSATYFKVMQPEERRRWLKLIGSAKACIADSSALMKRKSTLSEYPYCDPYFDRANSPCTTNYANYKQTSTVSTNEFRSIPFHAKDRLPAIVDNTSMLPNIKTILSLCEDLKSELSKVQGPGLECNKHDIIPYLQYTEEEISSLLCDIKDMISSLISQNINQTVQSNVNVEQVEDQTANENTTAFPHNELNFMSKNTQISTFFSDVRVSFADVMQEALEKPKSGLLCSIRSQTYIDACIQYAHFFDLLAGTLLSPLRNDILSNAEKIQKVLFKDRDRYIYLQLILEDEIMEKKHLHPDSATQAVIWMMRGLRTISKFLITVCSRDHPLYKKTSEALEMAYREHLSRFHNFIVQKMFSAGIKFLPSIDHFKKVVISDKTCNVSSDVVETMIMQQTITYSQDIMKVVEAIEIVYTFHRIDL